MITFVCGKGCIGESEDLFPCSTYHGYGIIVVFSVKTRFAKAFSVVDEIGTCVFINLMLVIGGKNSANTTRLAQICAEKCRTYHIETAAELQQVWFDKIEKIGITAGASTPDWIIKEVYKKCQN